MRIKVAERAALALVLAGCSPGTLGPADAAYPDGGGFPDASGVDGAPSDAGPALAEVHFVGRFDTTNPSAPAFAFPGSAIMARFFGTGVDADLDTNGGDVFAIVIDGAVARTLKFPQGRAVRNLATGLPLGVHDIALYKRTESFVGVARFGGFTIRGGTVVPSPFPFARRVEIVGDSISCGYGAEGVGPNCPFSADTESEWGAWGAVAARTLGAAHTTVCYSGKGVIRNYGGGTTELMPEVYERTLGDAPNPRWNFGTEIPDVVVVNLGTNDFSVGDPGQAFADAYYAFLQGVRKKYPSAYIVCAAGTMLDAQELAKATGYIGSAVAKLADPRVSTLDLGVQQQADGIGCDWHPSLATQQKMGAALAAHIKKVAGW